MSLVQQSFLKTEVFTMVVQGKLVWKGKKETTLIIRKGEYICTLVLTFFNILK